MKVLQIVFLMVVLGCSVQFTTAIQRKISAFNIQIFGQSKMEKPEVMADLVQILQRYDMVLIQEIRDSAGTAIIELLGQLNADTGDQYSMVIGNRQGRSSSKEQYCYFYKKMGKSKYTVAYTCAECGNKFDKISELDGHYDKKHRERCEVVVSCEHCDYQSNRKHDVTRHTQSRHPEKCRPKESKSHTSDDEWKRSSPGPSTKTNPPKVMRTENTWPTLDSLLGSPTKSLDGKGQADTSEKTRTTPPTPYVTPRKRQDSSTSGETQDSLPEQSPDPEAKQAPSGPMQNEPNSGDQKVTAIEARQDGLLIQRTTTTVNLDGSVKVVVEKFQKS